MFSRRVLRTDRPQPLLAACRRVQQAWRGMVRAAPPQAPPLDWEALQPVLEERMAATGVGDHPDPANGPANPDVHTRLFGKAESDIRVKFYRDSAAWCPYCQRIWLMLEEKRIPYRMEKINMRSYGDKPRAFLQKVPSGLLPVVELDGRTVTESAEIMMLLEETFTEVSMLPRVGAQGALASAAGGAVRAAASMLGRPQTFDEVSVLPQEARLREAAMALLQLERDIFGLWCRWLYRPLEDASEERAREAFAKAMEMVDGALAKVGGGGPFFLGDAISMVDIMTVPFLERQAASLLYWKGFKIRNGGYDNIDRWFEALEKRDTYNATQSDQYTHCWDIPPQYGTCWPAPNTEHIAKAINGKDGTSWALPLPPLNAESLEARSNVKDDGEAPEYRVQAARRLIGNHVAVTRFALRGAPGAKAGKHFSAPLSDPAAQPRLDFERPVAAALCCTAAALLQGTDAARAQYGDLEWLVADGASRTEAAAAVRGSIEYLRDRVGVPRDLRLPAARQLRAHLNWTLDLLPS